MEGFYAFIDQRTSVSAKLSLARVEVDLIAVIQ